MLARFSWLSDSRIMKSTCSPTVARLNASGSLPSSLTRTLRSTERANLFFSSAPCLFAPDCLSFPQC